MKTNVPLIFGLMLLIGSGGCKKKSINCSLACDYEEELLFNFGFEGVTIEQEDNLAFIKGTDEAFTSRNDWDEWKSNPIGELAISYEDGNIDERIAQLSQDPLDPNNTALHYEIFSPNVYKGKKPYKSRIQMRFHQTQCIREYYQTCRIFFPKENMEHLKTYPELIHWLSIFEFWNNGNWTGEKYPFRVTVGLWKDKGAGNDIVFQVKADRDKNLGGFEDLWHEKAYEFPVPFDQWMKVELYVLEGDESSGRVYMAVTPNGGQKQVVFDITNTTQHPKEKCPDGFTHIQPLKWYTSDEVVNHMKNGGYPLEVYWDDWVVYRNKQP